MTQTQSASAGDRFDRFAARLDALAQAKETAIADASPLQRAAAVLHVFDPAMLRPYGRIVGAMEHARRDLIMDSAPAVGYRAAGLRSLKLDVRKAALASLGDATEMRRALAVNRDRRQTPLQHLLERALRGEEIVIEGLGYTELNALRQLYDWGMAAYVELPAPGLAEHARLRRGAVSVFEHLVDAQFVGRSSELQQLRDHVGVVSPSRWSQLRRFLPGASSALVIVGSGGAGKTALIGKFLLEHVDSAASGWFPFAYLPFDSDTLDIREPYTILLAAAAQLSSQIPPADDGGVHSARAQEIVAEFRASVEKYRDQRGILRERGNNVASVAQRLAGLSESDIRLYEGFCVLLRRISSLAGEQQKADKVPVLLVLDSFEEVLYRARQELDSLWQMLTALQRSFPALRIVIASRTRPRPFEIAGHAADVVELKDLDADSAVSVLKGLGVTDDDVARALVKQLGGHPLTLRLAARVAVEEQIGAAGISGVKTKKFWMVPVADGLVQGQLYRRILEHIHDPEVRNLAHPGMVLRRVTPDLIQFVLAPVCKIEGVDSLKAAALFDALALEHTLVSLDFDGALKYRDDIRSPVFQLLAHDKPLEVRRLHDAAVSYYEALAAPSAVDRAEEIYHRLLRGDSRDVVMSRWMPGIEQFLGDAVPDLSSEQTIILAERMSIELSPEAYAEAKLAVWERLYGQKALYEARFGRPEGALALLQERKERTADSPLFAIEARCLLALHRNLEAYELLSRAIAQYPPLANAGRLAELLWMQADCALSLPLVDEARDILRQLVSMSSSLISSLTAVQATAALIEVENDADEAAAARNALSAALLALNDRDIDAERSVIRVAVIALGAGYPKTLTRMLAALVSWWRTLIRVQNIDLRPALEAVRGMPGGTATIVGDGDLKQLTIPEAQDLAGVIVVGLMSSPLDSAAAARILTLLAADRPTLRGTSLAGLDDYREQWELNVAPEVLA